MHQLPDLEPVEGYVDPFSPPIIGVCIALGRWHPITFTTRLELRLDLAARD